MSVDTEVLIAGAGPIGLALACDLVRWGVPFRIVDKKLTQEKYSKAANFWPRTQEVTVAMGFGDRVRAEAVIVKGSTITAYGKLIGTVMDTGPSSPTPYPDTMAVNQGHVEHIMVNYLAERGQRVEYGTEVTKVTQDDERVEVEMERDGKHETVRCLYVVACDGGKSVVREQVGLHLEPKRLVGALQQIDARLRWSRPVTHDHMWFFLFNGGFLGVVPLPGNYYRLFLCRPEKEVPPRQPMLEEILYAVRNVTHDARLELSDPVWFSYGLFHYGVAPTFQKGRVLLAGDAGHMTIPVGGQGMNTGIQDAFNLGWKLAGVLQGRVKPIVLESYSQERHKVRLELAQDQEDNFNRLMHPTILQKSVMTLLGPLMMNRGQNVELGDRDESQLTIHYPESPLNEDHLGRGGILSGHRALDARVVEFPGVQSTTLFHHIYNGNWTLLAFDHAELFGIPEGVRATLGEITRTFPWIRSHLVLANRERAGGMLEEGTLLDLDREAHQAYSIKGPSLYLIRPDGHVAFRGTARNIAELEAYCKRFMNTVRAPDDARRVGDVVSTPSDEKRKTKT